MWFIVGLGNPGPQYVETRHNVGFMVVEELARRAGQLIHVRECEAITECVFIDGKKVLLVKPNTYMNESGLAVSQLLAKYPPTEIENPLDNVLIVADDFALPLGKVRVRRKGSAGGHNGLKSVIARLKTDKFPRLRLGVAPDYPINNAATFVLREFPRKDRETLAAMVARAADAVETIVKTGLNSAMNKYNGDPKTETPTEEKTA